MAANKYNSGKIYKLVNDVNDQIYIGSTTTSLSQRFSGHKMDSKKHPNQRIYKHVAELGGWEHFKIVLIEEVGDCENKMQLGRRERYWIDELKAELNKCIPCRTREELVEYKNDYNKEYYVDNRDDLRKKFDCELCGGKYTKDGKSFHIKTKKHQAAIQIPETA